MLEVSIPKEDERFDLNLSAPPFDSKSSRLVSSFIVQSNLAILVYYYKEDLGANFLSFFGD